MKAGIVGIGAATAMALTLRARVRELVLVNRNRPRAKGVATDTRYGTPLSPLVQISDGDYADLAGAGVVIIAAAVNEKTGLDGIRRRPRARRVVLSGDVGGEVVEGFSGDRRRQRSGTVT
jgi:L-lactate dehydrogenase